MGNERAFSILQWGKESTKGTAVAADTMLLAAPLKVDPDRKPHYPQDLSGTRAKSTRSYFYEYLVRNTLSFDADHPAYFQALPMLFSLGLKGNVTPSDGGVGDYTWTHTPSLTAANTPDTITLECGDGVQAYEAEYAMIERLKFGGVVAQDGSDSPLTIDADFFARQWTATTATGSLSLPSTEFINAKLARFYLNTAWADVGTTEKTGLLRAFNIDILTGLHPQFHGGQNRYFDIYGEGYIDVTASFTFEGNSDADAIWDAFNSQALAVVRLQIKGAQISSGGYHTLTLDIGGTWEQVIPMGGEDRGNNLHTAILRGKYDSTGAKLLQATCLTNVSAI